MFGPSIAQSVAGLNQAERTASAKLRESERKRPRDVKPRPGEPDGDEVVVNTQALDAVRSLKSNDQEEAHEDHLAHGQERSWYLADGSARAEGEASLDLEA